MKFKDLPLKTKLFLSITILIISPLVIVGIYLNNQFANLILYESSERTLQTLKQTKQNFDTLVAESNDLSIRMLSNTLIQKFAKDELTQDNEYDQTYWNIHTWLDDLIGSKTYYSSISIHSPQGILFQKGSLVDKIDEAILEKAIQQQGKGFWHTAPGEISYYRAIMDFDKYGRYIGVEVIDIKEQSLYQYYKDISSFNGSQIHLLDSDGLVISSTNRSVIGHHYGDFPYVQRALMEKDGFFKTTIDKEKIMVFFYTIEDSNWTLMQLIPEKALSTFKRTVNTILVIVITLCVLFGVLFSFIQHHYMLKPLQQLRKEMGKLKSGNFNIELKNDSNDEIGVISNGFVRMVQQLGQTINDVYVSKIKQREAELTALEVQINPHFLYNTLDSIHWTALKHKNYDVSEQVEALAAIFRHVLNRGEPFVTIREELEFLNHYMFIQQRKYGKRIKLQIEADHDLLHYKMPKLILQPLVENAITHGLEQVIQGGEITVKITKIDDSILFVVSDNGQGTDEAVIHRMMANVDDAKHVFALKNINDRIQISYGIDYGLMFSSQLGVGTRVEVRIPTIN